MEAIWEVFVGVLEATLFLVAQGYGGELGPAILTLSVGLRVALVPLTYRSAVRALQNRRLLRRLAPQLNRLKETYSKDPTRLAEATLALHRHHGVSLVDRGTLAGALIQAPLALGMLALLRRVLSVGVGGFLWIRDLSRPDVFLAGIAAGLLGLSGAISGGSADSSVPNTALVIMPLMTFLFLLRMSAGFGLHMAASGGVALLQSLVIKVRHGREP